MTGNRFSAADSALGYLYQVRVALLWSLSRIKQGEFVVSIETLDDVTFETKGGTPEELLQTKHHRTRAASLTDMSVDLWKTLRVWFEGHTNGQIPVGTCLYLLTTAAAPAGSAASYLRLEGRDVARAQTLLDAVPASSQNPSLVSAFAAFNAVSATDRRTILDKIIVLDQAPGVLTIDSAMKAEVFWTADPKHHDAFLQRLEGWWFRRVINQLAVHPQPAGILSAEIEVEIAELREQFKQDNLPIDDDILEFTLDDATHAAHENYQFVHQLRLIEAGQRRVAAAIRDFYRAGAQRSRWLREDLLLIGDLSRYEGKLVEEWELAFEAAKDEIATISSEADKRKAARSILKWAEHAIVAIRPGVTEPFVVRGSFHMLADERPPRIGWHPDFNERLAELLKSSSSVLSNHGSRGGPK